jgi:hypothetical protein
MFSCRLSGRRANAEVAQISRARNAARTINILFIFILSPENVQK